jgi:hypothetical protein
LLNSLFRNPSTKTNTAVAVRRTVCVYLFGISVFVLSYYNTWVSR